MYRIILLLLSMAYAVYAGDLSPREIIKRGQDAVKLSATESVSTLTIIDQKGRQRLRKLAQVSKLYDGGKTEKRLVRFLEPADVKGTGLLTIDYENKDDDMWLYMPALRKTRRIVSSEKAKSFMGSEFSYADMTPPRLGDFTYQRLPDEEVDGAPCYVVEMTPLNEDIAEENGFSRRVVWSGKKDFVLRKTVYYDLDGELYKVLQVKSVKLVDPENSRWQPTHMVMENLQNGRRSILRVEKILLSKTVKDDYFTTRYLERE